MTQKRKTMGWLAVLALFAYGCGNQPAADDRTLGQIAVGLGNVDALTGVDGIAFAVTPCDGGETVTVAKPLEDMMLPGGILELGGEPIPFDQASSHYFADQYFLLAAGCYDVTATALIDGEPTDVCASATKEDVIVVDGETTEILLVLQCQGAAVGGLDVVGALNHPPVLVALTYDPSKFTCRCETVEICISASDPDGDPLTFVLGPVTGPAPASLTFSDPVEVAGVWTQCAQVTPAEAASHDITITVFDMVLEDGELITVEEWVLNNQGQVVQSRDSLIFPLHVGSCGDDSCLGDDPQVQ